MAFFKFRWPGQDEQRQAEKPSKRTRAPQAESIDEMRRRARHRLIGAAVLVLVGIVGFPLLFDAQPRPIAVDIPIDIPDRNKVAPLVVPAPTSVAEASSAKTDAKSAAVATAGASAAAKVVRNGSVSGGLAEGEELVSGPTSSSSKSNTVVATTTKTETKTPAKTEPKPEPKPELRAQVKPEPKPEPSLPIKPDSRSDTKAVPHTDEAARARALLEGRSVPTAGSEAEDSRFIVQVGAFADADKAREVRSKVERAGMKTYTQVVDTKDGKRTRVRVGPFANRVEADKAVARIKGLDLPASVLAL